jgi:hypothetical protein
MSDAKHTPGPWGFVGEILTGPRGLKLGTFSEGPGLGYAADANARLIAAAPELLEALQLVVDKLGSDFELYREQQFAIDTARAAIAKATGSTHV